VSIKALKGRRAETVRQEPVPMDGMHQGPHLISDPSSGARKTSQVTLATSHSQSSDPPGAAAAAAAAAAAERRHPLSTCLSFTVRGKRGQLRVGPFSVSWRRVDEQQHSRW
jgi:hypothetical protein